MSKVKDYTITIFSENTTGLLSKIVGVISRRHYDIQSLSASPSSIDNIYRFTICLALTEDNIRKLVQQIEKMVDVLKAFYYPNEEIIYQELALFKVPTKAFHNGESVERLIRSHNARIITIENDYIVIEKTGLQAETTELLNELKSIGIYEFVRSGKIAIVKPMERLNNYLKEIDTAAVASII